MTDDPDAQDEALVEAKAAFHKAVLAFHKASDAEEYVDGWVLVTNKRSPEMEQEGQTSVGVLMQTGQPYVLSLGMLHLALSAVQQ